MKLKLPDRSMLASCLSLVAVITSFSTFSDAAERDLTYWVSEHFEETPNIFEKRPSDLVESNPTVVDLRGIDWHYDADGDVRLCFDNRPLMKTFEGPKIKNQKWKQHCRYYNTRLDYKKNSPESILKKQITEGVLIYRSFDGKPTCKATFTIASLYSVLQSIGDGMDLNADNDLLVYPYFRSHPDPFYGYPSIKKYLDHRDTFKFIEYSYGGYKSSLKYSISCLLPAFQTYWAEVRDKCVEAVENNNFKNNQEKYFPILKFKQEIFRKVALQCGRNN